jgi:hypothetical protein
MHFSTKVRPVSSRTLDNFSPLAFSLTKNDYLVGLSLLFRCLPTWIHVMRRSPIISKVYHWPGRRRSRILGPNERRASYLV